MSDESPKRAVQPAPSAPEPGKVERMRLASGSLEGGNRWIGAGAARNGGAASRVLSRAFPNAGWNPHGNRMTDMETGS